MTGAFFVRLMIADAGFRDNRKNVMAITAIGIEPI